MNGEEQEEENEQEIISRIRSFSHNTAGDLAVLSSQPVKLIDLNKKI